MRCFTKGFHNLNLLARMKWGQTSFIRLHALQLTYPIQTIGRTVWFFPMFGYILVLYFPFHLPILIISRQNIYLW